MFLWNPSLPAIETTSVVEKADDTTMAEEEKVLEEAEEEAPVASIDPHVLIVLL